MWTGTFNLNTLRVDEKMLELRIKRYPDMCGPGLSFVYQWCALYCQEFLFYEYEILMFVILAYVSKWP